MGCWVSCVEFDARVGKVREHSDEVELWLKEMLISVKSIKRQMREQSEAHILEMRELKTMLASLNEVLRKSEGVRKGEAVRVRELVREQLAAIQRREDLEGQEHAAMHAAARQLEETSREADAKKFTDNLSAISESLAHAQAQRKRILDDINADTNTDAYHPGTWITYFHKTEKRFYHWWTCCQQIGAGVKDVEGCHNRRPRDLTLGKLEGGSLPRLLPES